MTLTNFRFFLNTTSRLFVWSPQRKGGRSAGEMALGRLMLIPIPIVNVEQVGDQVADVGHGLKAGHIAAHLLFSVQPQGYRFQARVRLKSKIECIQ